MKNKTLVALSIICTLIMSSCSVRSHISIADCGRSADGILVPLEQPTLCKVDKQWYMCGVKANIERNNAPWVRPEQLPADKRHPERYTLGSDDFSPIYSAIPTELAENLIKGKYTHSDAISFINRKWTAELPEGNVERVETKAQTPDYFRLMSSHRLMQTEQGNFLLANIGELTADFSSIYAYPLAGLCAIIIDAPASFFYSPPVQKPQTAQPETVE